jgi:hypothetical protein
MGGFQGYNVRHTSAGNQHMDMLSAIESIGWRLENVGYVYVITGAVTRDKMLSSGQEAGVMGETHGIYLFRRADPTG